MDELKDLWLRFNDYSNQLADRLGRTSNIVGEYAEYLVHRHYGGRLLDISESSADVESEDGTRYQVKSRKIKGASATQLNVIRSWNFDYLIVVLFDKHGGIRKAIEVPVEIAREYAAPSEHQRGWVITTSAGFLGEARSKDITEELRKI